MFLSVQKRFSNTAAVLLCALGLLLSIHAECASRDPRLTSRSVATYRKTLPPMLLTYFAQPGEDLGGAGHGGYPRLYLGAGAVGTVVRDSALVAGAPRLSYGGFQVSALWQRDPEWLVRGGMGYVFRTFARNQDPTPTGNGQVGQYWSGTVAIEYTWLHSGDWRLSSGWANEINYGYRSRNYFSSPTYKSLWLFKTGISSMVRYAVSRGVDLYADGQWLFGLGKPWESQGTLGLGVLFRID